MSYCSLEEAWSNVIPEKKKKKSTQQKEEVVNVDSRSFSRDIKTQKDFNGPEERYHIEPIKLEEDFTSSHENIENVYKPAEFESKFNNNNSTNEIEWIKEQLKIITDKISQINIEKNDSPSNDGNSPTADVILYLSTGILTIFLIDVFLKNK